MRRVLAFVLLVVAAASVPFVIALGRAEADPAPVPLANVSWITGHWAGKTTSGQHIEEMWMPGRAGLMLGSFRWERGDGRWLFEFMSLDAGTSDAPTPLTLRLKHFDRAFRGMEEKTASTTFRVVEQSASRALFERKDSARAVRLLYEKTGPDTLLVTFDETETGKPATHLEFPYTRVK